MTLKPIKEEHYMQKSYACQMIEVDGGEVSVLEMLSSVRLANKYVLESPDDAHRLFDRVKMHNFLKDEMDLLGTCYYMAYCDDSKRGVSARLIGQELGIDNSVSSRDVEGEGKLR